MLENITPAGKVWRKAWQSDIGWGLATLATILTLYARVDANAQAKVDAVKIEVETLRQELHATANRVDVKTDALLFALHVPNPAPAPKDGGQ